MRYRRLQLSAALLALTAALLHCTTGATPANGDGGDDNGACSPGDSDGLNGGSFTFDLTVDDDAFAPIILKSQNLANVALTLRNAGSKPHDFVVSCLPTPNGNGCPQTSCFPDASTIGPLAPDASATTMFATPNPEGIYDFRSDLPGDTQAGQFVVQ